MLLLRCVYGSYPVMLVSDVAIFVLKRDVKPQLTATYPVM